MTGAGGLPWRTWRHLTKIDPDKPLGTDQLRAIAGCGTDAIVLGGTQGVTSDKVAQLLDRFAAAPCPVLIEVSSPASLVAGAAAYLIPVVLNAGDPRWLIGAHRDAVLAYGSALPWDLTLSEGYVVLNPGAAVAQLTGARPPSSPEEVVAYAVCGEKVFGLPLIYLEYSGVYGDSRLVAMVRSALTTSRLFYGGGIEGPDQAREMGELADTIVVGNLAHADWRRLCQTVRAVK